MLLMVAPSAGLSRVGVLGEVTSMAKDHTLLHLDHYLEMFDKNAIASGAKVHWARTPKEATDHIVAICKAHESRAALLGVFHQPDNIGEERASAGFGGE